MGLLTGLFGSSKKGLLHDGELGDFTELTHHGDVMTWKGQTKVFNETISLYMSGNSDRLNSSEKTKLLNTLKNEAVIEPQINEVLRIQYEQGDKEYSNWQTHFNCITMSTMNNEVSITFEEKESLYHFNVFLLNSKVVGASIDS
ncbi:MAG: hypothetical protein JWR61_1106 [Ferruginibacter sp.]|uniref:hypothetical protein n=1 Tax=Ferruginibacter sp. TaxID=1940288 RepID=UPI00265AD57E|nr:hypothetical protein [Ferruginibacter sp.]MDB5276151.1 hypothetical protein [Ferruginibacter sp.]